VGEPRSGDTLLQRARSVPGCGTRGRYDDRERGLTPAPHRNLARLRRACAAAARLHLDFTLRSAPSLFTGSKYQPSVLAKSESRTAKSQSYLTGDFEPLATSLSHATVTGITARRGEVCFNRGAVGKGGCVFSGRTQRASVRLLFENRRPTVPDLSSSIALLVNQLGMDNSKTEPATDQEKQLSPMAAISYV